MIWYVALGSAVGGMARYSLTGWVQRLADSTFPLGTLAVNVTGSLVIGFFLRYTMDIASVSAEARALLAIGFCGGFTTFSTFSYETIALMQEGQWARAGAYVLGSVALSLGATVVGLMAAHQILAYGRQA